MASPLCLFKIFCHGIPQQSFSVNTGDNGAGIFVVGDVPRIFGQDIAADLIERMS